MKVFKIFINVLFNLFIFTGFGLVWLSQLELVEKILFTILGVAVLFLRKIYSSFKEFVSGENNRIRLFTDHILDEYQDYGETNEDMEVSLENDFNNEGF